MNTCDALMNAPAWLVMWGLAGVLFFVGKAAVVVHHQGALPAGPGLVGFVFFWVGMDLRAWGQTAYRKKINMGEGLVPALRMGLGALLVWVGVPLLHEPMAQGWCGMIGVILMLHFGAFELLAVFWRGMGVPVVGIMDHPTRATSLADFWGRRWNRAFRDLAHPFLFRPMARRWGQQTALWGSFLVSGLVHELLISVPTGAGYGLPTLYFLLQALGSVLERRVFATARKGKNKVGRWLFTHAFTVLPAFILFHPPFVIRVFNPFLHMIGAQP